MLFTYSLATDPGSGSPLASYFTDVTGVDAPDERTVTVSYRAPFSPALQGWENLLILPRHRFEGTDLHDNPLNRAPIGTGPYRFVDWSAGRELVLEANDAYWNGRPFLDRIVFRIIQDLETAYGSLLAGELDMATLPQSRDPRELLERSGGRQRHQRSPRMHVPLIAWKRAGSKPVLQ